MTIPDPDPDPDTDIQLGEPGPLAPRKRAPGVVLSVRLSGDVLAGLERTALREHATISEVARTAIEAFVSGFQPQVRYVLMGSSSSTLVMSGPTTARGDHTQNVGGGQSQRYVPTPAV